MLSARIADCLAGWLGCCLTHKVPTWYPHIFLTKTCFEHLPLTRLFLVDSVLATAGCRFSGEAEVLHQLEAGLGW